MVDEERSLDVSEIRGSTNSVQELVLHQMERINFLMTNGLVGISKETERDKVGYGIFYGLRTLETLLKPMLSESYQSDVEKVKKYLFEKLPQHAPDYFEKLNQYYDMLVLECVALNIYPNQKESYEFD